MHAPQHGAKQGRESRAAHTHTHTHALRAKLQVARSYRTQVHAPATCFPDRCPQAKMASVLALCSADSPCAKSLLSLPDAKRMLKQR